MGGQLNLSWEFSKSVHKENEDDLYHCILERVFITGYHASRTRSGGRRKSASDSYPIPHGVGVFQYGSLEKLKLGAGKQEVSLPLLHLYSIIMDLILKP